MWNLREAPWHPHKNCWQTSRGNADIKECQKRYLCKERNDFTCNMHICVTILHRERAPYGVGHCSGETKCANNQVDTCVTTSRSSVVTYQFSSAFCWWWSIAWLTTKRKLNVRSAAIQNIHVQKMGSFMLILQIIIGNIIGMCVSI
jgi:hypothetical protein